jgi:type II secretory pathway pseudopilin PulG
MVTTVIMGIILVYVFGTLITSQRKAQVLDQVIEAQQNSRVIAELLERDLRQAGFMVPEAAAICGIDNLNAPDVLWVSDAEAINPVGSELDPSLGAAIQGAPINIVTGTQLLTVDSLVLEKATPSAAYDNDGNGTLDTDFQDNAGVIVADENNPSRGSACGTVSQVLPGTSQIRVFIETPPLAPVPVGGDTPSLKVVPARRFFVDANQRLFRDFYLIASDVEDLQLAFFFDANRDNVVDVAPISEYRGDGNGADYVANANDNSTLREVRLNVVMRTRLAENENNLGRFQTTENRLAVAGADGFKRRVQTSTVRLRNLGGRTAF